VESAEDVLRVLGAPGGVTEPGSPPIEPFKNVAEDLDDPAIQRLESLLSATPTRLDDLARDAGISSAAAAAALVELSLADRAELLPGGLAVRR
jgi:DNA processing protein